MSYQPPEGNRVGLSLAGEYIAPPGDRVGLALEPLAPLPEPPRDAVGISSGIAWRETRRRGLTALLGYGLGQGRERPHGVPWSRSDRAGIETGARWATTEPRAQRHAVAHGFTLPRSAATSLAWRTTRPVAAARSAVWADTEPLPVEITASWRNTLPAARRTGIAWHDAEPRNEKWSLPYLHIRDLRKSCGIPWGQTVAPPTVWKDPVIFDPPPPPPPDDPVYIPPPGNAVGLRLDCLHSTSPGLHLRKIQCLRRQYVVDNSIIIRRVSDQADVTALSVRLSGDLESFAFGFSATVPRAEGLDLISPADGPVEIEVIANGQPFLCLVEQWSTDQRFPGESITVQGRSIVAELDEPYTEPRSRTENETLSALQLMLQELPQGSDWTISADGWTDYTVPAGTLSYTGLSRIRAIALIAQASGAVIRPEPDSRTLRVAPRFRHRPWDIVNASADVEIDYGMVTSDRGQWLANRETTPRQGIYVEGEANGAAIRARLTGTAGNWAEPVVDPLITDPQAGLQRAITEIGQSWVVAEVGLELPLKTEGEDATGWIYPGQVVLVTEAPGQNWRGISTSWEIAGAWSDQSGLTISQRINVERYLEPA